MGICFSNLDVVLMTGGDIDSGFETGGSGDDPDRAALCASRSSRVGYLEGYA